MRRLYHVCHPRYTLNAPRAVLLLAAELRARRAVASLAELNIGLESGRGIVHNRILTVDGWCVPTELGFTACFGM